MSKLFDLEGKVAIVTGAARGMGRTHALLLSEAGAKVTVSDILFDECQKVVQEIQEKGGEAIAIKCDISDKEDVDKMISETVDKFNKIDILVNNAGIADFKDFMEMTEEDWDRTMDINLKGYFLCSQAAAKEMAKNKSGNIINIGSIAMGQTGISFPNLVHYVSSKGGVAGMTEALAMDLARYNIRVNGVAPGVIETPMVDPMKQDSSALEGLLARLPMKRMGNPEEISSVVVFLASEASSYMTGAMINVDGGWLAS